MSLLILLGQQFMWQAYLRDSDRIGVLEELARLKLAKDEGRTSESQEASDSALNSSSRHVMSTLPRMLLLQRPEDRSATYIWAGGGDRSHIPFGDLDAGLSPSSYISTLRISMKDCWGHD